jgi:hypothetical protein
LSTILQETDKSRSLQLLKSLTLPIVIGIMNLCIFAAVSQQGNKI